MIVITGTSGHLGRLVVEQLAQQVDPAGVIATARSLDAIAALADLGVATRELDYDRPDTIATALDGATQVLLVSSSEIGRRVPQHTAVIEAAVAAGVEHIAYTSILRADTSPLIAAIEHRATEEVLARAGVTSTRLRHGWYIENYTGEPRSRARARRDHRVSRQRPHRCGRPRRLRRRRCCRARRPLAARRHVRARRPRLHHGRVRRRRLRCDRQCGPVRRPAGRRLPGRALGRRPAGAAGRLPRRRGPGHREGELDVDPSTLERLVGRPLTSLRDAVAAALR